MAPGRPKTLPIRPPKGPKTAQGASKTPKMAFKTTLSFFLPLLIILSLPHMFPEGLPQQLVERMQ
eukprot:9339136-Pyramimonas_sp.AAC.1